MTLQAHITHNINLSHAHHITDNLLRAKSFHDIVTQQIKNSRGGGEGEKSSIHLTPPPIPRISERKSIGQNGFHMRGHQMTMMLMKTLFLLTMLML